VELMDSDEDGDQSGVKYSNATDIAQNYLQRLVEEGKLSREELEKLSLT
jgi:hypothetical protein